MWSVGIDSKVAVGKTPPLYPFVTPAEQGYTAYGS